MSNYNQAQMIADDLEKEEAGSTAVEGDAHWLALAREAYRTSTDYVEHSLKKQWEKNMAHFRSKHAPGSKYYSDTYRYRSKIFRPKPRAAVRKHEAAAAAAYFATDDAVHVMPEDEGNMEQVISAEIKGEIMNYRLDHSIPWFQTLVGAYQETMNIGVVVSYQHWEFREKTVKVPTGLKIINEEGELEDEYTEQTYIVEDRPVITLRPAENVRIDPASDWADPINTSPYLIDEIPMYVIDVKEKMNRVDPKTGQPEWRKLSDGEIMSASRQRYDSLRQAREGSDRSDSKDSSTDVGEYSIVWVNRNFIREDDQHVVYYTLGSEYMLSDPKPIEEVYRRKTRPYVMGICQIEAHRTHPSAMIELAEQIVHETNEIANARIDNLKLAINQRHYIRRGADIDFAALMRSAPGSGIMMDDVNGDVKPEMVKDVTSSSYAEQDRLNADFDDVVGGFSSGSVATNRAMNETVGGMEILSQDANKLEEYQLRVFNETWVEPTLNQLMDMIQEFETDENILAIAGKNSKTASKNGIREFDWRMLQAPVTLKVAVGFGATNPQKRIEKLSVALRVVGEFMPDMLQDLEREDVINEIFGAVGSDGSRFFKALKKDAEEDPQVAQLKEQLAQLQQIIEGKQVEQQGKERLEKIKQDGKLAIENIKAKLAMIDKQLEAEKNELARSELLLEQSALLHQQRVTEITLLKEERGDLREEISGAQGDIEQNGMADSRAGLLQRNDYGNIPFAEG